MVVRRKGQKGVVVFFGFTTEVRTTRLFYIYGSWVSKRILILRDRIPNYHHHGPHFIQFWCTYAKTLLKHGQIVTPGAFYARAWVYFMTTLLCRDLFSLNMFGLLYTPGNLNASMLNDLAISRGEEEIEKSDCRLTLCRHCRVVCSGLCKPNLVISSHDFIYWSSVSSEPSYQ